MLSRHDRRYTPRLPPEPVRIDVPGDDETHVSDNESTATTLVSGEGDTDSAIDDLDRESTCTMHDDMPVVEENGRKYLDPDKYPLPSDEREQERLDMLHEQWLVSQNRELALCPRETFVRVLDICTGTGVWAIDFADAHPEAHVIGVDISPIQPNYVPPNCEFQIDDVSLDWTWRQAFDFVHARMPSGCFSNLRSIFRKAFENLKPGGHFEVKDVMLIPQSDDGTLKDDSPLLRWAGLLDEAARKMGRPINLASQYQQMLVEAGFTDVHVIENRWPINNWPKDHKLRMLGLWSGLTIERELETISMVLLTHGLHWEPERVLVLCASVRKEFLNPEVHAYFPVFTAFGMKPWSV
ncbi:hypothetical protein VTI74DRAFT_3657 [Chaetomium olivicolor]